MRGIVTVVNKNWDALIDVLIESVLLFSNETIFIGTVGFEKTFDNPRVLTKCISHEDNFLNICRCKHIAVLESGFDEGVFLDGDCIVGPDFPIFFDTYLQKIKELNIDYPLCSRHPYAPDCNFVDHFKENVGAQLSSLLLSDPLMPYAHANYFFTKQTFQFLNELVSIIDDFKNKEIATPFLDESVLNFLLATHKASEQLDVTFTNFYPGKIDKYVDGLPINNGVFNKTKFTEASSGVFHGEKNAVMAQENLEKLKEYVYPDLYSGAKSLNAVFIDGVKQKIDYNIFANLSAFQIYSLKKSTLFNPKLLGEFLEKLEVPLLITRANTVFSDFVYSYLNLDFKPEILFLGQSKYDLHTDDYNENFNLIKKCHGAYSILFLKQESLLEYAQFLKNQTSEFVDEFFWCKEHNYIYGLKKPITFLENEEEWTKY